MKNAHISRHVETLFLLLNKLRNGVGMINFVFAKKRCQSLSVIDNFQNIDLNITREGFIMSCSAKIFTSNL